MLMVLTGRGMAGFGQVQLSPRAGLLFERLLKGVAGRRPQGFLECLLRCSNRNLRGEHRFGREYRHNVGPYLGKSTVYIVMLCLLSVAHAQFTIAKTADQWRTTRQNSQFAVEQRKCHKIGRLIQNGPLWSNDDALQAKVFWVSHG